MEITIGLLIALAVIVASGLVLAVRARRAGARDSTSDAWAYCQTIADEIPGLLVVPDEHGWPRLTGIIHGVSVEIDAQNQISATQLPFLGLRCYLDAALHAPNAAVWIGEVAALHTEFGRPRPLGDPDGLFEVHTRAEPTTSDWWMEPELQEALLSLTGAGLLLVDGALTVVFSELDVYSVRTALSIPALIQRGVRRVTLH